MGDPHALLRKLRTAEFRARPLDAGATTASW